MVLDGGPMLIRSWMNQLGELRKQRNIRFIWVTSGAIASARKRTGKVPKVIREKQALSAIGQPHLVNHYLLALQENGDSGAQILLTADDLGSSGRRHHLQQTLNTLLDWQYLPILNENDAVATEEIQFGDNDRLASLVALHMKATRLILLTDVEGLFDRDPKVQIDSKRGTKPNLITELNGISPELVRQLKRATLPIADGIGRGGMLSKILAAKTVSDRGIHCHLVKGDLPRALLKIAESMQTAALTGRGNGQMPPGTNVRPRRVKK